MSIYTFLVLAQSHIPAKKAICQANSNKYSYCLLCHLWVQLCDTEEGLCGFDSRSGTGACMHCLGQVEFP